MIPDLLVLLFDVLVATCPQSELYSRRREVHSTMVVPFICKLTKLMDCEAFSLDGQTCITTAYTPQEAEAQKALFP